MSKYITEEGFYMPPDITKFLPFLNHDEMMQVFDSMEAIGNNRELPKGLNRAVKLVILYIISYNKWVYELQHEEESEVQNEQ